MSSPTSTKNKGRNKAARSTNDRNGKLPEARVHSEPVRTVGADPLRWLKRGIFVAIVAIGWVFISWHNRYRFAAPVVMLQLGWLAVVSAVYFLWHTGASASAEIGTEDPWWRPVGELEELEREKRALLKAIKEVEFDQQMGKQSVSDANEIVSSYRARAIEVIKAIDALGDGKARTVREQIQREVRARIQFEGKIAKVSGKPKKRKDDAGKAAPNANVVGVGSPVYPGVAAKTNEPSEEPSSDDVQAKTATAVSEIPPAAVDHDKASDNEESAS
jgi:hypothetical protein